MNIYEHNKLEETLDKRRFKHNKSFEKMNIYESNKLEETLDKRSFKHDKSFEKNEYI